MLRTCDDELVCGALHSPSRPAGLSVGACPLPDGAGSTCGYAHTTQATLCQVGQSSRAPRWIQSMLHMAFDILFILYTIRTLPVGSVRTEAWDIYCRIGSYWTATVRPAMRVCTCLCFLTNWNLFVDVSESARSSVLSVVALCGAEMRLAGARTSSRRRRTSR